MKTKYFLFLLLLLMGCNGNIINVEPVSSYSDCNINEPAESLSEEQSSNKPLDAIVAKVIGSQTMQDWNRKKAALLEQTNNELKKLSREEYRVRKFKILKISIIKVSIQRY
jgi:hypothetical protein